MKSISSQSFVLFNEQLTAMVRLDLPLPESLRRASAEMGDKGLARTIESLAREVERGSSFSAAIAKHSGELPEVYAALVKAGEASGNLPEVLRELTTYSYDMMLLKSTAKANLIYPAMLAATFAAVALLFTFYIMPSFEVLFHTFGSELPLPTQIFMNLSGAIFHHPAVISVMSALAAAAVIKRRNELMSWWEEVQLRVPVWGDYALSTLIARLCATLGLLMKNAVPLSEALTLTEASIENRTVRGALAQVRASVARGEKAGAALVKTGVFPRTFTWLLSAAEERGDLESCLLETAVSHQRRADRLGRAMALLMEPIFIVVCGAVFGAVIIALFLPMFGLGSRFLFY